MTIGLLLLIAAFIMAIVVLIQGGIRNLLAWAVLFITIVLLFGQLGTLHIYGQVMKIYLDDLRPLPDESWTPAKTWWEFKNLLNENKDSVTEISFDHDLGFPYEDNGYKCMCYLELLVETGRMKAPLIHIHTANPSVRDKMNLTRDKIMSLSSE